MEENQTSFCKGHHDDVSSCLQVGKLVSSLLSNNEADRKIPARSEVIWKEALLQYFHLPPSCFCSRQHFSCPLLPGSMTVYSMGAKYEVRNVLKERKNTSITSACQCFSALVALRFNYRAAEACRCLLVAPGKELHQAHHTSTVMFLPRFTGTDELPKFKRDPAACLVLNSWVIFPKPVKADMALLYVWILCCLENWRPNMQLTLSSCHPGYFNTSFTLL